MATALDGVRILDLSRVLAAPLATQWLADLGANVIKVERPGAGDESRSYGPPFLKDADGKPTATAAFFLAGNRNKQSIAIDHSKPEGQGLLRDLAAQSDVFVENFRTGTLKKYGLDYESLRKLNPRLVYLSVTGFGQTGPNADRPGYDGIFQAMCGLMSVSGYPHEPMKVGISMVDILTGLFAGMAVLAALRHRDATGEGQHIDLALFDCGLASLTHFAMNYFVSGEVPQRRGNGGFGGVPSQVFACEDASLFLTVGHNQHFEALCRAIECADLSSDPRFDSTAGRISNRDTLLPILEAIFRTRLREEWLRRLDDVDVPAGPVNELPDVLATEQVRARTMRVDAMNSLGVQVPMLANPIRFSATPIASYSAPPQVGEHTEQILSTRLGLDSGTIAALRRKRVI